MVPAYDTEFARYSPGLIQLVRMAEEAGALGVRSIDLGKGDMRYKDLLKSYDLTVAEGTVLRRTPAAALHWAAAAPPRWAVRQIRAHPRLFGRGRRRAQGDGAGQGRAAARPVTFYPEQMRAWVVREPGPMASGPLA